MKVLSIAAFMVALFFAGIVVSYVGADLETKGGPANSDCPNFVDADGDGINDNCPNKGERPQDGTGLKKGNRKGTGSRGGNTNCPNFVDEDGDGINDNCPNKGERPQDGTGIKKRASISRSDDSGNGDVTRDRTRTRDPNNCGGKIRRNIRRGK